ncbi:hypothetical protein EYC84_010582 [Monilinia fructicola]|uniref:BRCT domain-containing protein n=1 Tax=Monilinia fructicola TaxID=38448 RepID=A0A5M9J6Q8_MONFR|nr:hypothetical protein EYC84_010582 [Monilinia fructicola]
MSDKDMADPKISEQFEKDNGESQIEQDQLDAQLAGELQNPKLSNKEEQDLFDQKQRLEDAKIFSKPNMQMFRPDWLAHKAILKGNGDKLSEELAAQRMKILAEDQSIQQAENATSQQTVRGSDKLATQKTHKQSEVLDAQHNQQEANESALRGTDQQDNSSTRDKSAQTEKIVRPGSVKINYDNSWVPSAEELSKIYVVRVSGSSFHESLHATMDSAETHYFEIQPQHKHASMEIIVLPLRAGNTTVNEHLQEKNLKKLKEFYEKGIFDNLARSKKKTLEELPKHWAEKQDEAALDMDPPVPKKIKAPRKKAAAKPRAKTLTARENAIALVDEDEAAAESEDSDKEEHIYSGEEELDDDLYAEEEQRQVERSGKENKEEEDEYVEEDKDQRKVSTKKTGKAVRAPKRASAGSTSAKVSTNKTGVQHDDDDDDEDSGAAVGVQPAVSASARSGPRPKSASMLAKERSVFDRLPQNYRDLLASTSGALAGKIIVLSGVNPLLSRKLTEELIQKHGGKIGKVVTGRTHYAVMGTDGGSKMEATIAARNVPTLDEAALITLLESANAISNPPAVAPVNTTLSTASPTVAPLRTATSGVDLLLAAASAIDPLSAAAQATTSATGSSGEPTTLDDGNYDDEDEEIQPPRKRRRGN